MSLHQPPVPSRDEDRVRALFNAFQEAILIHDPVTGAILDANARASVLFGRPREELLALPLGDLGIGLGILALSLVCAMFFVIPGFIVNLVWAATYNKNYTRRLIEKGYLIDESAPNAVEARGVLGLA